MPFTISSTIKLASGFQMPILGLGVYRNENPIPACKAALKHGYRHIDTAQGYHNEAEVGQAVRESGVKREEIFVTTKISHTSFGYQSTLRTVEESLKKLGFTYVDLYLLHSPLAGKARRLESYKALLDAQAAGKIRSVGVSNFSVKHLEEIREAGYATPAVNQIELQPFCQQKEIVAYDDKNGIVTQAFCPLIRAKFDDPVLQEISNRVGKEVPQVLVRWSIQRGFSPLPKSSQPERVVSNANIYDFELSASDMEKINALDRGQDGAISWNPINAE